MGRGLFGSGFKAVRPLLTTGQPIEPHLEASTIPLLSSPENEKKERVKGDGASTATVRRNGAPPMAVPVRCLTGDNASAFRWPHRSRAASAELLYMHWSSSSNLENHFWFSSRFSLIWPLQPVKRLVIKITPTILDNRIFDSEQWERRMALLDSIQFQL